MIIDELFATPVGYVKYEPGLSKETEDYLMSFERKINEGNQSSIKTDILDDKYLSELKTFIEKSLHEYFVSTYNPKYDVRLKITQSWLNWSEPGRYHHLHCHPNSLVSGCYYIKAKRKSDKIVFKRPQQRVFSFPAIESNMYNTETYYMNVENGDLLFFPSDLNHFVPPVEGEETRLSLAFNTFPVGMVGDQMSLTELIVK